PSAGSSRYWLPKVGPRWKKLIYLYFCSFSKCSSACLQGGISLARLACKHWRSLPVSLPAAPQFLTISSLHADMYIFDRLLFGAGAGAGAGAGCGAGAGAGCGAGAGAGAGCGAGAGAGCGAGAGAGCGAGAGAGAGAGCGAGAGAGAACGAGAGA